MRDVLVLGAGPAGLTAAIYAARAGKKVVVFDRNAGGGQVSLTGEVGNYPGRPGATGADLAGDLYTHAVGQGAEIRFEQVDAVELDGPVKRFTTGRRVYEGRTAILAAGARRRRLEVPGEEEFLGKGVSTCAACDAAFFRGKTVAISGGGDAALADALLLANGCERVYLIHRRDSFRAARVRQELVRARANIEVLAGSQIAAVEGGDRVERVLVDTPEGQKALAVAGVFVAIGLLPETGLLGGLLPLSIEGYVRADEGCATPLPGVWVVGDLREKPLRQIVTAAADGAVAGLAAAEYCDGCQTPDTLSKEEKP